MYRIPKSSGSTYLPRDETSHGTNSDSSDTENKSQDLNWLSQRQGLTPSSTERQIPISIRQEDRQLQYSPKKGIWLVFHLLALCITVLWHFVMKICSTFARKIWARKIISLALFLLSLFFFVSIKFGGPGSYHLGGVLEETDDWMAGQKDDLREFVSLSVQELLLMERVAPQHKIYKNITPPSLAKYLIWKLKCRDGTYYMGLLDGGGIQMSNGIYYNGFVLSDFNHFWHKDESKISGIELQSLRRTPVDADSPASTRSKESRRESVLPSTSCSVDSAKSRVKASHVLKELQSLKEQIDKLQTELYTLKQGSKDITQHAVREVLERSEIKGVTTWTVKRMLNKVLEKLDEDQVQMPDYALKSAGASIIQSRTTRSYRHNGGKFFWLSFPMLVFVKSPEVILQPSNYPGDCWPFPGNQGETLIKLAMEIIPRAVTMEHISKKISPTGEISSAPKDFAVYGLKEEDEEQGTFLGQFLYNHEGDLFQTFQLKNELPEFMRYVKLKVLNNWGHPEYTCIYRFRVHGDLKNAQEFFQQSPIP